MKVENVSESEFRPIELKLTIETKEELYDLLQRLDAAPTSIPNFERYPMGPNRRAYALFHAIDEIARKRGLV